MPQTVPNFFKNLIDRILKLTKKEANRNNMHSKFNIMEEATDTEKIHKKKEAKSETKLK